MFYNAPGHDSPYSNCLTDLNAIKLKINKKINRYCYIENKLSIEQILHQGGNT